MGLFYVPHCVLHIIEGVPEMHFELLRDWVIYSLPIFITNFIFIYKIGNEYIELVMNIYIIIYYIFLYNEYIIKYIYLYIYIIEH